MSSSGMLRRVTLVRTDVSEERSSSIIRVTRIVELGTLAVISNQHTLRNVQSGLVFNRRVNRLPVTPNFLNSPILVTLMIEALSSSERSVFTKTRTV
jgi:hypothetical protein